MSRATSKIGYEQSIVPSGEHRVSSIVPERVPHDEDLPDRRLCPQGHVGPQPKKVSRHLLLLLLLGTALRETHKSAVNYLVIIHRSIAVVVGPQT